MAELDLMDGAAKVLILAQVELDMVHANGRRVWPGMWMRGGGRGVRLVAPCVRVITCWCIDLSVRQQR